jgi:hypothetical protein
MRESFSLLGNSGQHSVTWEYDGAAPLVCRIVCLAPDWSCDPPTDHLAFSVQARLAGDLLERLVDHIDEWLALPIHEQRKHRLHGRFSLTNEITLLEVDFGERSDIVQDLKPTVTVRCRQGELDDEVCFLTDPSCLTHFVAGVRAWLALERRPTGRSC